MLIVSIRSRNILIGAVLIAMGVLLAVLAWPRDDKPITLPAARAITGITTNDKRVKFIEGYGWKVDKNPMEVVEITIPSEFNRVYQNYNSIQKKQGFDLAKFKGQRVKRWTYRVLNYPNTTQEIHANLLISGDQVIGGDVSSVALNGFMHGFAAPTGAGAGEATASQADITQGMFESAG